jgi:hypothetical protein
MIHPAIGASPISLIMKPMTDPAATTTKTWAMMAKQVTLQILLANANPIECIQGNNLQNNHPRPPGQINMMIISIGVHLDHICSGIFLHLSNRNNLVFRLCCRLNPILSFFCHLAKYAFTFESVFLQANKVWLSS